MSLTVEDFLKEKYPGLDKSISPLSRSEEDKILSDYSYLNLDKVYQSYRRYGYVLSNFFAQKVLYEWAKDYDKKNDFTKCKTKILNSGMSAITTVLESLSAKDNYTLITMEDLYYGTTVLLKRFEKKFEKIIKLKNPNVKSFSETLKRYADSKKIIYLESISNSPSMWHLPEAAWKELASGSDYLAVDNTLMGAPRTQPIFFDQDNIIYIESLTKNYHSDESSLISLGYLVYPQRLNDVINETSSTMGLYLQLNDLLKLPLDMYRIGKQNLSEISRRAHAFYDYVKNLPENKRRLITISNFEGEISTFPPVLFLDLKEKDIVKKFIEVTGLKERGSFGHQTTTILPIGLRWDTVSPGLMRLAFGKSDDIDELIEKTNLFFQKYVK